MESLLTVLALLELVAQQEARGVRTSRVKNPIQLGSTTQLPS